MRFIPTKVHGILDYMMGLLLIAAPWLFDFADGGAKMLVPIILGAGAIIYSLMTDYELGVSKAISMPKHLTLDLLSGILLAASPWLFGFADEVYSPHLVLGILEIGAALFTKRQPEQGAHTKPQKPSPHIKSLSFMVDQVQSPVHAGLCCFIASNFYPIHVNF